MNNHFCSFREVVDMILRGSRHDFASNGVNLTTILPIHLVLVSSDKLS